VDIYNRYPFTEEGELASFIYKDNKFYSATNVAAIHPEKLLERVYGYLKITSK
jgi:hypothetical protein